MYTHLTPNHRDFLHCIEDCDLVLIGTAGEPAQCLLAMCFECVSARWQVKLKVGKCLPGGGEVQ
jgi:hypothetical protein